MKIQLLLCLLLVTSSCRSFKINNSIDRRDVKQIVQVCLNTALIIAIQDSYDHNHYRPPYYKWCR
jgi:hypothetical protein